MERVAVVTGAADGLGQAFARRFAVAGYQVVAADINDAAGESLVAALEARGERAHYQHCDVTVKADVEALVAGAIERFGAVHVLVNNAVPPAGLAPIEEKTDEAFQRQLDGGGALLPRDDLDGSTVVPGAADEALLLQVGQVLVHRRHRAEPKVSADLLERRAGPLDQRPDGLRLGALRLLIRPARAPAPGPATSRSPLRDMMTTDWTAAHIASIVDPPRAPPIRRDALTPMLPGVDLWDWWPVQDEDGAAADGGVAYADGGGGGGGSLSLNAGSLASKDAALKALNDIAAFFRRTEPHSPVAYLLERAVAWANMPLEQFLAEVIRDESTLSSIRERVGLPPSY